MRLSKRLGIIHDMVPSGVAVDVGSDHGYLIISLLEDSIISHGIAIENKKGPFEHLNETISAHQLCDKIESRLSDGITSIHEDVNSVIIAGMGGDTIIDILEDGKNNLVHIPNIIVDPHSAIPKVRKYIVSQGYYIDKEEIVLDDDIYYEIISFKKGNASYTEKEYKYGPLLIKNKSPLFIQKHKSRIDEINHLLDLNIPSSRKEELQQELEEIKDIL